MVMATATDWQDDEFVADPDELKMPESPEHRRVIDAIGVVASLLLETTLTVYRDMNWYPPDGGNAVAPDLMVLAADAPVVRSYKETPDGPSPTIVVEVPSRSDGVSDFFKKSARYRALGVDFFTVLTDSGTCSVLRFAPGRTDVEDWTGRPIAELGGLSIDVRDDRIVVVTPDGHVIVHDADISRAAQEQAAAAQEQAAAAQEQAAAALRRVAELESALRAAGIEP
jgi:Putative restriction endonuclease